MLERLADPTPELGYLGEVICELLDAGAPEPADDYCRVSLLAQTHIARLGEIACDEAISEEERAFFGRDTAVRAAAQVILAATRDPGAIRLIREELMEKMRSGCAEACGELGDVDPGLEAAAVSLMLDPYLANVAELLLDDPGLHSSNAPARLLEDVHNVAAVFIGLAWRLRAWATIDAPA